MPLTRGWVDVALRSGRAAHAGVPRRRVPLPAVAVGGDRADRRRRDLRRSLAATSPEPFMPPNEDARHALGTLPPSSPGRFALLPVFLALLVASAVSMRVRYRRAADAVVRAQLKWFAVAGMLLPFTLLLCWAGWIFTGGPDLVIIGLVAFHLAVPVATAIAILRHDLYDVDRALSGAVTYAW